MSEREINWILKETQVTFCCWRSSKFSAEEDEKEFIRARNRLGRQMHWISSLLSRDGNKSSIMSRRDHTEWAWKWKFDLLEFFPLVIAIKFLILCTWEKRPSSSTKILMIYDTSLYSLSLHENRCKDDTRFLK